MLSLVVADLHCISYPLSVSARPPLPPPPPPLPAGVTGALDASGDDGGALRISVFNMVAACVRGKDMD